MAGSVSRSPGRFPTLDSSRPCGSSPSRRSAQPSCPDADSTLPLLSSSTSRPFSFTPCGHGSAKRHRRTPEYIQGRRPNVSADVDHFLSYDQVLARPSAKKLHACKRSFQLRLESFRGACHASCSSRLYLLGDPL